ncbi:hypothetical protein TCAL_01096 [Tigriopus californicus]|uniref:MD-2-related lipid-recognition domain-containing protein n=1 Tax=Tigriopus californicus TaxID=6832 RepID=A0A553P1I2_TIGCA|nr:hypothetical protein TCAL_01096 [Tigriopus californicus]
MDFKDMPRAINGERRMTNIPVGNGEYVRGIRKNDTTNVENSKMPNLNPSENMRPLRYTAGLVCDPELERLRPERNNKHPPLQSGDQWKKKLIQHPQTYEGSFADADMQQFRPAPEQAPQQDPWMTSRLPEGQSFPANERLAIPQGLSNLNVNPYDQVYPQDELSRIKERNRRFAHSHPGSNQSCGQEMMMEPRMPYGYGHPSAMMMPPMGPMMPMMHQGQMFPNFGYPMGMMQPQPGMMQPHPNMPYPPQAANHLSDLQFLNDGLDAARQSVRPYIPSNDPKYHGLQADRQRLEEVEAIVPKAERPCMNPLPTSINQLPEPKKRLPSDKKQQAPVERGRMAPKSNVGIAEQIAIRSIVLGNNIPSSRASEMASPMSPKAPSSQRGSAPMSPKLPPSPIGSGQISPARSRRSGTGANRVVGLDIEGCRRRESSRPGWISRFRCDGSTGPPCIVKRGDTVNITFDFKTEDKYSKAIQDVFWVTGFGMELPWAGMEKDVCKFMDCNALKGSHQDFTYTYPIAISQFYPSGAFNLKWLIKGEKENGEIEQIGCSRLTIRIV